VAISCKNPFSASNLSPLHKFELR